MLKQLNKRGAVEMLNKKVIFVVMLFVLLSFILCGCGQDTSEPEPVGIGEDQEEGSEPEPVGIGEDKEELSEPKVTTEELIEEPEEAEEAVEPTGIGESEVEGLLSLTEILFWKDSIDYVHISIQVKNNSEEVVKDFKVAWMGFDEYGYPVKTGWLQDDFLCHGFAEAANIQPGATFGKDHGWDLGKDIDAKKFIACIAEISFYEGEDWINPYYETWVNKHLNKPLVNDYKGIIGVNNY